jgi:gamma-glutamylcyclotransferase (GGCT)/AIG2-like uncharacterized protein YtfP
MVKAGIGEGPSGIRNMPDDALTGEEPQRIFVYGSLMDGFFNYKKIFSGNVLCRTPARVRGILYHQTRKGYPALIPGEGWVQGEFLELRDFLRLLVISDELENYRGRPGDNEYERRITPVELLPEATAAAAEAVAYVYWYDRNDLGTEENPAEHIPSGDWRAYMEGQSPPEQ